MINTSQIKITQHPDEEDLLIIAGLKPMCGYFTNPCSRESVMGQLAIEILNLREQQVKALDYVKHYFNEGVEAFGSDEPCPYSSETFECLIYTWGWLHADNIHRIAEQDKTIAGLKNQVNTLTSLLDTEKRKNLRPVVDSCTTQLGSRSDFEKFMINEARNLTEELRFRFLFGKWKRRCEGTDIDQPRMPRCDLVPGEKVLSQKPTKPRVRYARSGSAIRHGRVIGYLYHHVSEYEFTERVSHWQEICERDGRVLTIVICWNTYEFYSTPKKICTAKKVRTNG